MALIAGIDEAGLGPVLGPLVVSAVAFELPDELLRTSLWRLLSAAVCRKPSRRGGKVAIADSKKLYSRQRPKALAHLERGVLGMLATRPDRPKSLRRLLAMVAPASCDCLGEYPWYADSNLSLPHCITPTDLTLAANSLQTAMRSADVTLAAIQCEVVLAGQFNRHVTATRNKSTTLFDVTSRLLFGLWRDSPSVRLRIAVDRHGGRKRYLPGLQRIFDGCEFKILQESDRLSAYRITEGPREAEICFYTDGDVNHLPVALASMVSKYVRELFMAMLNRFWVARVPGLSPTAGYYTDGRRFYREITPAARRLGVGEQLLYRCR